MSGYLFLAFAIATEVVATAFLTFTSGDSPKWWAFAIVAIVVISWIFFKESLCWVQIAGIVLVIAGVGLLELGGKHA